MKKFAYLMLIMLCLLALSACGKTAKSESSIDFSKLDEITGKAEQTPEPTQSPTPTPEQRKQFVKETPPTIFSGYGDDVITIDDIRGYVFHIKGNSSRRYFGVIAYDSYGNRIDALVNTTDVYDGVVIDPTFKAHTFEILCTCEWSIELVPLSECEVNK